MNVPDALMRQLLDRLTQVERRLGIQETIEVSSAHSHAAYVNVDGTTPLTGDWDAGAYTIQADTIAATDANGISIKDDGGNLGVFVKDGGDVAIGHASPLVELHLTQRAGSGKGFLISGKEQYQEANGDDSHGVWFGVGVNRTANRQLWIGDYDYLGSSTNGFFRFYSTGPIAGMGGVKGDASGELPIVLNANGQPVGIGAATTPTTPLYVTGNAYFTANVSALSFTDRTPGYDGDALAELAGIKTKGGEIDHATLPAFARTEQIHKTVETVNGKEVTTETVEEGRDLGAMISMLTVAVQQLKAEVDGLKAGKKT